MRRSSLGYTFLVLNVLKLKGVDDLTWPKNGLTANAWSPSSISKANYPSCCGTVLSPSS
jgi:hypothetical protein